MRYLRNLVMAGSALLPLAIAEPVFAQEPKTNVQEITGIARSDIQHLLRDLDDDRFIVREKASGELAEKAIQWIKSHGQNLSWKEWILPQEKYSLEVCKRLERILEVVAQEERKLLWLPTRMTIPKEWQNRDTPPTCSAVARLLKEQTGIEINFKIPEGTPEPKISDILDELNFWQIVECIRKSFGPHYDVSQGESGNITIYPASLSTIERKYTCDGAVSGELWQSQLEEKKGHTTFGLLLRSEHKIPFGYWRIVSVRARTKAGTEQTCDVSQSAGIRPDLPYIHIPYDDAQTVDLTITCALTGYTTKTLTIKNPTIQDVYLNRLCAIAYDGMEERHHFWAITGRLGVHIINATYNEKALSAGLRLLGYADDHLITQKCDYEWDGASFSFEWLVSKKPKELILEVPEYEVPHTVTLRFFDVPLKIPKYKNPQ